MFINTKKIARINLSNSVMITLKIYFDYGLIVSITNDK